MENFQFVIKQNLCENIDDILNDHVALFGENHFLNTRLLQNCDDYINEADLSCIRITNENMFPSFQAWPLQLNVPFRKSFSSFIRKLKSYGILQYWISTLSKYVNIRNKTFLEERFIRIYVFQDSYNLLIGGLTVSLIIFLLEIKRII